MDRMRDREPVLKFCRNRDPSASRCLVVRCRPGTGVTSFLKFVQAELTQEALVVYADARISTKNEIVDVYFAEYSRNRFRHLLTEVTDWRRVAAVALKGLSALTFSLWLSRPLMAGGAEMMQPLLVTPFESQPLERLSRAIRSPARRRPVVFLIDNAHEDFGRIEGLLRTMHAEEYQNIRFVITYAAEEAGDAPYLRFRERVRACGLFPDEWRLGDISAELVSGLAELQNFQLTDAEAAKLAEQSGANIWDVMELLRRAVVPPAFLSPLQQHQLRILLSAGQPLRRSDLWALSAASPLVHVPGEKEFDDALHALAARKMVALSPHEAADLAVALAARTQPEIAALANDWSGSLPVVQEVYDFFDRAERAASPRHSLSYTAPLLYRLSKVVDPARTPARAQKLVGAALAQGSLRDAERYINEACRGGATSVHECYLQISFYIACLEFKRALEIIDSLGAVVERHRILVFLRAIALNRVREHEESLREIDRLVSDGVSVHELSVLASYKVAGLLHEERSGEAARYVRRVESSLVKAVGYGYFLRNAAAAFMWGEALSFSEAETLLSKASKVMQRKGDLFGELTVLNNRGVIDCYRGSFAEGLRCFQQAYAGLRIYGTHHLEEVGVNLGSVLLRVGRIADARRHLVQYCAITEWDFPRCLAENALALAEWLDGDYKMARSRMDSVLKHAGELPLADAQLRSCYNSAVLEAVAEGDTAKLRERIAHLRAANWTVEEELQAVERAAAAARVLPEQVADLWSLDYCQYWSQNPLALLPQELLTL